MNMKLSKAVFIDRDGTLNEMVYNDAEVCNGDGHAHDNGNSWFAGYVPEISDHARPVDTDFGAARACFVPLPVRSRPAQTLTQR